jgi:hypothetical protein
MIQWSGYIMNRPLTAHGIALTKVAAIVLFVATLGALSCALRTFTDEDLPKDPSRRPSTGLYGDEARQGATQPLSGPESECTTTESLSSDRQPVPDMHEFKRPCPLEEDPTPSPAFVLLLDDHFSPRHAPCQQRSAHSNDGDGCGEDNDSGGFVMVDAPRLHSTQHASRATQHRA